MYKKAAIVAIDECIRATEDFTKDMRFSSAGTTGPCMLSAVRGLQATAITGMNIAKRLLEEEAEEDISNAELEKETGA